MHSLEYTFGNEAGYFLDEKKNYYPMIWRKDLVRRSGCADKWQYLISVVDSLYNMACDSAKAT